jgi:hypothetical protein
LQTHAHCIAELPSADVEAPTVLKGDAALPATTVPTDISGGLPSDVPTTQAPEVSTLGEMPTIETPAVESEVPKVPEALGSEVDPTLPQAPGIQAPAVDAPGALAVGAPDSMAVPAQSVSSSLPEAADVGVVGGAAAGIAGTSAAVAGSSGELEGDGEKEKKKSRFGLPSFFSSSSKKKEGKTGMH